MKIASDRQGLQRCPEAESGLATLDTAYFATDTHEGTADSYLTISLHLTMVHSGRTSVNLSSQNRGDVTALFAQAPWLPLKFLR